MIIELSELQPLLDDFPECPVCRLGLAVVIEENAGPHSWDVVSLHNPAICPAYAPPAPNLHLVGAPTTGNEAS